MTSTRLTLVAHIGFVLTGMVTTLLGPILPFLQSRWFLNDAQAGYFFTAQFVASTVGVVCSGLIIPRIGFGLSLGVSYLLVAFGMAMMGRGPWALGLAALAISGIGLGIIMPATNLWVAELGESQRGSRLSVLNFAWGIGAVLFPAITGIVSRRGQLHSLFIFLAGFALMFAIVVAWGGRQYVASSTVDHDPPGKAMGHLRVSLALLFFLYVGSENGVAGWLASYAKRIAVAKSGTWEVTPSVFWGALLAGRAAAVPALRWLTESRLLLTSLLIAAGGLLILIGARGGSGVVLGAAIAGLGHAPVFPLLVALLTHRFGRSSAQAAGPIFAFASLGGACLPWLVGFTSQRAGDLRIGLALPLAAVLVIGAFLLAGSGGSRSLS
jgi:FHS family glucose/mannose:H+ symporter-like MFS transporter